MQASLMDAEGKRDVILKSAFQFLDDSCWEITRSMGNGFGKDFFQGRLRLRMVGSILTQSSRYSCNDILGESELGCDISLRSMRMIRIRLCLCVKFNLTSLWRWQFEWLHIPMRGCLPQLTRCWTLESRMLLHVRQVWLHLCQYAHKYKEKIRNDKQGKKVCDAAREAAHTLLSQYVHE